MNVTVNVKPPHLLNAVDDTEAHGTIQLVLPAGQQLEVPVVLVGLAHE